VILQNKTNAPITMKTPLISSTLIVLIVSPLANGAEPTVPFSVAIKRNNLVTELLSVSAISQPGSSLTFTRPREGWVFISALCAGRGSINFVIDDATKDDPIAVNGSDRSKPVEAVRHVTRGGHRLRVECNGEIHIEKLMVKAIPELIHCGLGFDPAIKSYGRYDMKFLEKDILPNVTTLIVPHNISLPRAVIDNWHRQGKRFVAEVGIDAQAKSADDQFKYWAGYRDRASFLDGVIINEFIVNNPLPRPIATMSAARQNRIKEEQRRYGLYEEAINKLRGDDRYKDTMLYAYVGGSGKKLNQEIIGPSLIRAIIKSGYRVALERYLFEVTSEKAARDALQAFVDGIADWEATEPGVKEQMIIAFGLFSMPPGGINKLPNVDYHVWMDEQMNVVANHPALSGVGGVEWWTSILADEETVRFVGKLYRHYAIDGKTEMLTRDPLFMTHIQNADFQNGVEGWTVQPAVDGSIQAKSFPRYGRIEGRYMGLGRPADPEHIGDTFLWMKRNEQGPNSFSQAINDLEPGKLYSMKMFTCDYQDLVNPKAKKIEEASKFRGSITIEGVDIDPARSFSEMYASSPEPPIPVWITYHWKVFRARATTATLIVTDWPAARNEPAGPFGQEQTFNFVEIQPYHE
jgi:hypothetical protein